VDPALDRIQPLTDLPGWSENLVLQVNDPRAGISVWAHWSRMPSAPGVWEGVLTCYLPDGALLTSRSFGRSALPDAASSGPATLRCVEPLHRWELRFDGLARRVTPAEVAAGPVPDGPVEPLEVALEFTGGHPVWDAQARVSGSTWASAHLEQGGRITGRVGDVVIDGRGFRDHSYGPRDYSGMAGNTWISAVFPSGRAVVLLAVWPAPAGDPVPLGYLWDGAELHDALAVDVPPLAAADGSPSSAHVSITTAAGTERLHVRATGRMNYSMPSPIGMILGTTTTGADIVVAECPAVVSWGDEQAAGWFEKSYRLPAV
jgi:hypothetical protein